MGCCRVIDGVETVELINSLGTNTFAGPVNADIRIVVRTLVAMVRCSVPIRVAQQSAVFPGGFATER